MSSFGSQIRKRVKELHALGDKLPQTLSDCVEHAATAAVKATVQATPPNVNGLKGTNTRSGQLAQHWVTDSKTKPSRVGATYKAELNNNMQYASYVNDGHRMDRHFVPGLVINEASGMLEYNPDGKGGIVVGTKTSYVKGLFMTDKAIEEYKKTVRVEADKLTKKVSK